MAPQLRESAAQPEEDLSSIPRTHTVEERTPTSFPVSSPHAWCYGPHNYGLETEARDPLNAWGIRRDGKRGLGRW